MVGMMAVSWGERAASLLDSAKASPDIPSKMRQLRQVKDLLLHREPSLITDFAARLADLQSDRTAPVRRFLAEMIGEVGTKKIEVLPEMVPTLISFLKDETPAVVRQAIKTGTSLFQHVLVKVAIQGLYSSELDEVLKASWAWMLKFKNAVIPIAIQPGGDGIRLLAIKFVEAMILLYTPDPNGSSDPPSEAIEGVGLNISWVRGGHPVLSVGDLAMEASQSLGLLLDQLRFPQVKSLSNSIIIVLVSSLSAVASKRPSFYGRILPVLLCLDPASSVIKGVDVPGAHHALKNAFVACLNCTHSSAVPWRARLVEALKAMNDGELAEQATVLNKISGGTTAGIEDSLTAKDESVSRQGSGEAQTDGGRKRQIIEENDDSSQGDSLSSKRARLKSPMLQETREESPDVDSGAKPNNPSLIGSMTTTSDRESKPIQQLVSMFAALVAQGDKAAQSLEILISSISSDLLTEVVVANMRHLPPNCPKAVEEEMALHSGNQLVMQASALVADILSLSSGLPLIASLLTSRSSMSHDIAKSDHCDEEKAITTADSAFVSTTVHNEIATMATGFPSSSILNSPGTENASLAVFEEDARKFESGIPGLESNNSLNEIQESLDASHTSVDLQGTSQEQALSSSGVLPQEFSSSGCMAANDSERFRPMDTTAESGQVASATSSQYFLPKMALQDVKLTDEEKDCLQKEAFVRILEAYKQIEVSGSLTPRFSVLANLGVEFPLELDPWALLQKHVVSDYVNHEGHELTLRVLYRLYRETEQDHDFLSSRTAASVYEAFLLTVAQTLRDTFPASDKSLGRLLADVPYLPEGVLNVLESLCSPASNQKVDKDFQSGDRVTQGLSAVWSLILLRPSNRERCLQIALQSAVHMMEEVRMKAIRLVANKLFPLPSICKKIEDFANEKLHSIIQDADTTDVAGSADVVHKDNDLEASSTGVQPSASVAVSEVVCSPTSSSSSLISEAQRRMSLYFALCTKRHSLLSQIFAIYHRLPKAAKQAVDCQIPILVRTIGSSTELLGIISDPPSGSENLLMQVLQTLTDGAIPSSDLIFSVRKLYNSKMKDVEILIPILSYLPKDEVLPVIPDLVKLPPDKFQVALTRVLQGSPHTGPSLSPAEVLIAIHGIDPEKDKIPLKKVMDACSACFELRDVFTQQVLAKVLNQLVEQIPLPLLFMRTVIQAIGVFPALVEFIMEILSRLVSKQIWKYPKLWVGFLKCAIQTKPQSFNVLLQLPAAQLENALNKNPVLRSPLVEHANQPNIRQTLPRSTLVVLGLVNDSQTSRQPQASQSQATDASGSAVDAGTEVTQESTGLS